MPTPARAPAPPPVQRFEAQPTRPVTPPAAAPPPAPIVAAMPDAPAAPRAPSLTPMGKRGINPFLNNDPNQKGRRLARALVSDMIAYQPGKKEEGLANGTLKAIFREEIKKSYEEYVDQIGKEFADTTTHFQDALNDLLAGGQKMF
jgi:hypothetical protein